MDPSETYDHTLRSIPAMDRVEQANALDDSLYYPLPVYNR